MRIHLPSLLGAALLCLATASADAVESFTAFESAHVRPLALSADGSRLYAVNTPDNRLTVYRASDSGLVLEAEIPVGLEPVAVALREHAGRTEAWVVNHLSDSISIVEINLDQPGLSQVTRTLLVGDEPRDIVFAGPGRDRAFISTAHRGQNRPGDPQLSTEGVGRADVWVFEASQLGADLGGTPLSILELFGDTPRALAVSPDGNTVYAAVFASGNQTTTLAQPLVSDNGGLPPAPEGATPEAPEVGLIVKLRSGQWLDEIGRDWSAQVPFSLPDYDLFRIDANADLPSVVSAVSGVGTVIYNLAVRPGNGRLYASNTEALNEQRFEPVLSGRFAPNRISIIDGNSARAVQAVHLNPHIDYAAGTGPQVEIDQSLATPMDMVFSPDGQTVYVAGFGSGKIGVFDTDALESGQVVKGLIRVGMGPSGLALDAGRDRLYVMNRLDQSLSWVEHPADAARRRVNTLPLPYNPEPASITLGRQFLYDASTTSGHGDVSCHSCHLFGDLDQLAWDLGNPYGTVTLNPNVRNPAATALLGGLGGLLGPAGQPGTPFHPMKGPMTTQSLRGLAGAGPMHWRGDKTGALSLDGEVDPNGDYLDENAAFLRFNPAFTGLQGRAEQLSAADMQAFADFMLQLRYPPNPIKGLDNQDSAAEAAGRSLWNDNEFVPIPDDNQACGSCHALPLTTTGAIAQTAQISSEQDDFKIAQLRNLYQKVGMFGVAAGTITGAAETLVGEQVRGFGYTHDGSISSIATFLEHPQNLFSPLPNSNGLTPAEKKANVEAFLLSLDTGLAPVVGQQLSVSADRLDEPAVQERLALLLARADAGEAELVVKGVWDGAARGALYQDGQWRSDRASEPPFATTALLALAEVEGQTLTFTAVPPGNGARIGIDRDLDGLLDGEDQAAGTVLPPAPAAETTGGALGSSALLLLSLVLVRRRRG